MHFVEQKYKNFNKNETESKMENPTHSFRETNLCFSSYKNRKLKVKLWWVGARDRKKKRFLVTFVMSKGIFFNIGVLSQCIVYWINFQNIHTFTYPKILLHTFIHFCCLVFKSLKDFSVSLSIYITSKHQFVSCHFLETRTNEELSITGKNLFHVFFINWMNNSVLYNVRIVSISPLCFTTFYLPF